MIQQANLSSISKTQNFKHCTHLQAEWIFRLPLTPPLTPRWTFHLKSKFFDFSLEEQIFNIAQCILHIAHIVHTTMQQCKNANRRTNQILQYSTQCTHNNANRRTNQVLHYTKRNNCITLRETLYGVINKQENPFSNPHFSTHQFKQFSFVAPIYLNMEFPARSLNTYLLRTPHA